MKRTRKELVELINEFGESVRNELIIDTSERLSDKLIKGGWVKIDEPREFWIVKGENFACKYICNSLGEAADQQASLKEKTEIIHVKEVIE